MREHLLLDLAYPETPTQSTTLYFRAHAVKSTIHHLSRCHRRVTKYRDRILGAIDTCLFLSGKLCGIQCEQIFFGSQMFMQCLMYAGPSNA